MTRWVLIWWIVTANGVATGSEWFADRAACQLAGDAMASAGGPPGRSGGANDIAHPYFGSGDIGSGRLHVVCAPRQLTIAGGRNGRMRPR